MPWAKMQFGGQLVFVRVDPSGEPLADRDGRVEMKYRLGDDRYYRASRQRLSVPSDGGGLIPDEQVAEAQPAPDRRQGNKRPAARKPAGGAAAATVRAAPIPADAYIVYTDGACSGNPGPSGIGVVILQGGKRQELSEYLGQGTNNIAELTAVKRALEELPVKDQPVVLHLDSEYVRGLLALGWKAKANRELVEEIRTLARQFTDLRFVHVDGHAGVPENERCDSLAREAIGQRRR
jgi:ribonuclease HI